MKKGHWEIGNIFLLPLLAIFSRTNFIHSFILDNPDGNAVKSLHSNATLYSQLFKIWFVAINVLLNSVAVPACPVGTGKVLLMHFVEGVGSGLYGGGGDASLSTLFVWLSLLRC